MPHIKTGGAAFPANPNNAHCEPGMTLRDYFAAKALVGLFAMEANPHVGEVCEPFRINKDCDDMACAAYKLADAMLAAREVQS